MERISTLKPFSNYLRYLFILLLSVWVSNDVKAVVVITIPSTPGTDTSSFTPTNRRYGLSGSRMLFTASEIGTTGTITAIGFQKSSGSTSTNVNYVTIYLRETTAGSITTSLPSTFPAGYKEVYNGVIDNYMASGWTTAILKTGLSDVFTYSGGSNNLEIVVKKTTSEPATTAYPVYNCHTVTGTLSAYYYHATAMMGTTLTTTTALRPNIQLSFDITCAGKPAAGTISGPTVAVCSGAKFTLTPTGISSGTGMHYQWQSRNAGSGAYMNMSIDDTFANLTTSTAVNKDYRVIAECVLSAQKDTSAGYTVTVVRPTVISAAGSTSFCTGGSLTLNSPTVSGITYTWLKDGVSTGTTGASYTVTASGDYAVRASTASCTPGETSNTITVTVHPLPIVTINPLSATTFCDGLDVKLEGPSATGITYQWIRGGLEIPGATAGTYTAVTGGAYRLRTKSTATGCINTSAPVTVTVNPSPAAPVISGDGGKTTYCASYSLLLSTSPVSGVSYEWENLSGLIPGATSSSYTAGSPDTYTLNAILGACTTKSNALVITENALPTASITPSGTVSFCSGDSLNIKATASTGVTYKWLESGVEIPGAPNAANYYARAAGSYSVRVTNTASGCYDNSATLDVSIIAPVIPGITASGPTTFCLGGTVTLEAIAGSGLSIEWQKSGHTLSGEVLSSYVATLSGDYRVKVTNGVGCAAYSEVIAVKVNDLPDHSITVSGGTNICDGASSLIMAPVVTGYRYQWQNLGVAIPGEIYNPYYAKTAGTYSVRITDSNGCEATSITVPVTVKFVKSFYIHPEGNTFFCEGEKTKLSTQKGFTSYQWYFNGAFIPGAVDSFVYADKKGKYSVRVQDPANSCFATSSGFSILVIAAPDTPFITQAGTRLSTAVRDVSYQWYKDGIAMAGATDSFVYTIGTGGVYSVEVTNSSDCSKSASIDLNATGIQEGVSTAYFIKVYPNPANDRLNIDAPAGLTVSLTDIQGRLLFRHKEAKQIDMTAYAEGIYILQFTDDHGQVVGTEKISKVNY